ncbi:MAG TPA: DUF6101 family protein [Pseudolabrys sp.]|nr:DUF6101 family protein [Pseudolabrys sp.]
MPAGSSRALRLDPFALPVQFAASDAAADERIRHVELHRERIVVRRAVRGMAMALNMPISAFAGVALRMIPREGDNDAAIAVILEHRDPSLAVPLHVATETDEVMAQWRAWGNVLGLPLLVTAADGELCEPFARLGHIRIGRLRPRRRRRTVLKVRRPSILMRRLPGKLTAAIQVHRGEREIIARN